MCVWLGRRDLLPYAIEFSCNLEPFTCLSNNSRIQWTDPWLQRLLWVFFLCVDIHMDMMSCINKCVIVCRYNLPSVYNFIDAVYIEATCILMTTLKLYVWQEILLIDPSVYEDATAFYCSCSLPWYKSLSYWVARVLYVQS